MSHRPAAIVPCTVMAACALASAGPGASPPAPAIPVLAYDVPVRAVIDYVRGDSARIRIGAAGQSFAVNAQVSEIWRMEFARAAGGTRVTATLTDLDGRLTNPLTAPRTADESAVNGPVVFLLDPRGHATVESLPAVTPAVAQFVSGSGIAHSFFPRLPGRAVEPGASWTDTVAYTADESGARTEVRTVTTYTAAGDSLVAGVRYLLVRAAGTTEQSSTGTIGGTRFGQAVAGVIGGHFLWDRADGALHALDYASTLQGTMDVAVAPVPLEVSVTGVVRVRRAAR